MKLNNITMTYDNIAATISEMEQDILDSLSNLEPGYGRRKWAIAEYTGIHEDILTVLLKRLKDAGKVKIITVWSERTNRPNGSAYCLQAPKE